MVLVVDASVLKGVPEFFENDLGESLAARTESLATFREMGPPDLCHIVKTQPKSNPSRDIGTYHYVLGVDASSMATLAAYLNSLTYTIDEANQGQGKSQWKLKSGTYCCFNAFSRVDVRVEVKIPGGVDGYMVDLRGERHPINNPAIWQETYVSAVLRTILDDNDEAEANDGRPLLGLRKLDPIPIPPTEKRFLEAAKHEFWKGWQLGTESHVQVASYFSNHLTNGIYKYFADTGRFTAAATFFESLLPQDPEVGALVARAYLEQDEEINAVKVLHTSLKRNNVSYGLLLVQIDFLLTKKRYEYALKLAKLAVTFAPSEYSTWAKLTEVYIALGDFESALLSLNSCPMFTYSERDAHRMPPPARTHLPLKVEIEEKNKTVQGPPLNGTIYDENDPKENEVHPELLRLPALTLKGTFMKAYLLLIKCVTHVGWDELLKYRSQVFVMEEEYRVHRALMEERQKRAMDEMKEQEDRENMKNDNALREEDERDELPLMPPSDYSDDDDEMVDALSQKSPKKPTPTILREEEGDLSLMERISLDSRLSPRKEFKSPEIGKVKESPKAGPSPMKGLSIDELMKRAHVAHVQVVEKVDEKDEAEEAPPFPRLDKHAVSFSFKSKRLCEKWLDNLFMVLYNDLRLYTALKQEISQFKNVQGQNALLYRKTGAEWEIYGDLALRLDHVVKEDAKEAYRQCLEQKFSAKSWLRLLELYSDEGNINMTLGAAVKLVSMLDKAFVETTYPSPIARSLFKLVKKHGLAKVQNALFAMNTAQKQFRMISRYLEYAELFKIDGVLW